MQKEMMTRENKVRREERHFCLKIMFLRVIITVLKTGLSREVTSGIYITTPEMI